MGKRYRPGCGLPTLRQTGALKRLQLCSLCPDSDPDPYYSYGGFMSAVAVDGTLVAEVGEGLVRVQVAPAIASELELGTSIELRLGGDPRRYFGTVLAVNASDDLTVLLDPVSMTDREALVEDLDDALGAMPGDVPPVRGMER